MSRSPRFTGPIGLAIIAVSIPFLFWLGFGRIDDYAIGFTVFLIMLAAAIEYLPPALAKAEQARQTSTVPATGPFDMLGVVWLLSIPFAPFFTWIFRNMAGVDRGNWHAVLEISAFFCVVVPIICVLPMLRYIKRENARLAVTVLTIGTAFPVAAGAGSAYDVVRGPVWQDVTIVQQNDLDYMTKAGTRVQADAVDVDLADGRRLTRAPGVALQMGPNRVLVLRGVKRIIAVAN